MQKIEVCMWLVTLFSIIGTIANIHHKRYCFAIWLICNVLWAAYDIHKQAYPQAVLMAIYAVLAVWGWIRWGK